MSRGTNSVSWRLFANEEKVDPSYLLRDGDELTVIMQIGGG